MSLTTPGRRRLTPAAAVVAGIFWASAGGAAGQVPDVPEPPVTSTTVPAAEPPPPPKESPAPVPEPGSAPAPPTTDAPGAPATPVTDAPAPGAPAPASPTPKPVARGGGNALPAAPGIDLSEIANLRQQALGKGPRVEPPDHGFDGDLPFRPGGELAAPAEGSSTTELGVEDEKEAQVRSLAAIAGGVLVLVLLGLVLWLLRQAQLAPAGARAGLA